MKVTLGNTTCKVERGDSQRIYKDSTLMTHIRRELQRQGYDVITKDLSRDKGNLLSPGCYGVRTRKLDETPNTFVIVHSDYCIDSAYKSYNRGQVMFTVLR